MITRVLSTIILSIFGLTFLPSCQLKYWPESKPKDGSIWYPEGLRVSTHRRLGLSGKTSLHIDTILNHARYLGYGIQKLPPILGNEYIIRTMADRYNTFWLDYNIVVASDGSVESIVESRLVDADLGVYVNYVKFRNFVCFLCPKIELHHPVATSEYANTGPLDVKFPNGMEKSIRFRLGLADVYSIHIDAVANHSSALGYKVKFSSNNLTNSEIQVVLIETGLSLSRSFIQNFEVQVGKNGWIQSIKEIRVRR